MEQHRTNSSNCPMFLYDDKIQAENTAGDGFTHLRVTAEEYGRLWPFLF
jgi:hypothetical protein